MQKASKYCNVEKASRMQIASKEQKYNVKSTMPWGGLGQICSASLTTLQPQNQLRRQSVVGPTFPCNEVRASGTGAYWSGYYWAILVRGGQQNRNRNYSPTFNRKISICCS